MPPTATCRSVHVGFAAVDAAIVLSGRRLRAERDDPRAAVERLRVDFCGANEDFMVAGVSVRS